MKPIDAQELLEQIIPGNRLILKLQSCMKDLDFPGVTLSHKNKVGIQAFKDDIQRYIDHLIAQRERLIRLVKQIPDVEIQLVLQLRYGLLGNETKKMSWLDIPPLLNYEMDTLYKRHRKGIDYLNTILGNGGENQC